MKCGVPGCNTYALRFASVSSNVSDIRYPSHFCYRDGQKIIVSQVRSEIEAAVQSHFRRCKLFEY
jgi:hypothetical protein